MAVPPSLDPRLLPVRGAGTGPKKEAGRTRQRFGYYVLGVAIGFTLLGVIMMGKKLLAPQGKLPPGPAASPRASPEGPARPR